MPRKTELREGNQAAVSIIEGIKTPCYMIKTDKFVSNLDCIRRYFFDEWQGEIILGYSVKTNHFRELMRTALQSGMQAEVVSEDEYVHAINCGFSDRQIILNGPQKPHGLLLTAIKRGAIVNLDNLREVEDVCRHAGDLDHTKASVGLRVNFDLEKVCSHETTAGNEVSRFGLCFENGDLQRAIKALRENGIRISGLHMHYSSKTRSLNIFEELSKMACRIIEKYDLLNEIQYIDMGGGFFMGEEERVIGKPSMADYARVICRTLRRTVDSNSVRLVLEPGASLLASAVDYVCTVLNRKRIRETEVITTDGSMLHINPFMSKRIPRAELLMKDQDRERVDSQIICGSTCMENDRLLYLERNAELREGDQVLIHCAGAYTMSFNGFFINPPPYVYKKGKYMSVLLRDRCTDGMMI